MPPQMTPDVILAAIDGFTAQRKRIDAQIEELRSMLPTGSPKTAAAPTRKRKKFSPAAIQRMKEAQQKRWAKLRGESQPAQTAAAPAPKPKRKLSAAAKARLIANLKKARAAKAAKAGKKTVTRKKAASRKTAPTATAQTAG